MTVRISEEELVLRELDLEFDRQRISLKQLREPNIDQQVRINTHSKEYAEAVRDYASRYLGGSEFPAIIVEPRKDGTGKFNVLAGNTRVAAGKSLNGSGPESIDCLVVTSELSPHLRTAIGVRENRSGKLRMDEQDVHVAVRKSLGQKPRVSRKQVAQDFGITEMEVENIAKLEVAEAAFQALGVTGRVDPAHINNHVVRAVDQFVRLGNPNATPDAKRLLTLHLEGRVTKQDLVHHLKAVVKAGQNPARLREAEGSLASFVERVTAGSARGNAKKGQVKSVPRLRAILTAVVNLSESDWNTIYSDAEARSKAQTVHSVLKSREDK